MTDGVGRNPTLYAEACEFTARRVEDEVRHSDVSEQVTILDFCGSEPRGSVG